MSWRKCIAIPSFLLLLYLAALVITTFLNDIDSPLDGYFLAVVIWSMVSAFQHYLQQRLLKAREQFADSQRITVESTERTRALAQNLLFDLLCRPLALLSTLTVFLSTPELYKLAVFWCAVAAWCVAALAWCFEFSIALRYWWIGGRRRGCTLCWFNPLLDLESLPRAISLRDIEALPLLDTDDLSLSNDDLCVICLERLLDDDARLRQLDCQHIFHADCVDPWLCKSNGHCPTCRQMIQLD